MGCGHVKKNKGNYLVAVLEIFTFLEVGGGGGGICLCACVDTG